MKRIFLFVFIVFVCCIPVFSQNQFIADSLVNILEKHEKLDTVRLHLIAWIIQNQNDPERRMSYSRMLASEAELLGNTKFMHHANLQLGQSYRIIGDYEKALQYLFVSLDYAKKIKYGQGIAGTNTALGDVYSYLKKYDVAVTYYKQSIHMVSADSALLATTLINLGDTYYTLEQYDSALFCFESSREIYEALNNDPSGLAYNLGNIGLVQAKNNQLDKAEKNLNEAIAVFKSLGDHYGVAIFQGYMAELYQQKNQLNKAIQYADSSLILAIRYGLMTEKRDNLHRMAMLHEEKGDFQKALLYQKEYTVIKDSLFNVDVLTKIENLETKVALAEKEAEVDELEAQKRSQHIIIVIAICVVIALSALASIIYFYYRSKIKVNHILKSQKNALERLNATKDKFFSIISHDLRGPVSSLLGVSLLIRKGVSEGKNGELLEVADQMEITVSHVSVLLDDLLNWALQQQGHFPNVPEKVDLNRMGEEIINVFSNMAAGKNITLTFQSDSSIFLWVDRNSTHTILRNLINNAIKFTHPGGEVKVLAFSYSHHAEIRIIDKGVGMSRSKLKSIFTISDTSFGTVGEKGLGLGLQLVSEFIKMNKGTVEVASEIGKGTTFTVKLPIFKMEKQIKSATLK